MNLLRFSHLQHTDALNHAITTRHGGSSTRSYASLNLGFHVGDDEINVQQNRHRVARNLNIDATRVVSMQQTHSANMEIVTRADCGRGALDWQSAISNTDALITDETNLPLLVLVADCAPLLIVDIEDRVLAVVHAGWRGAVSRIASKTVEKMAREFGSKAENLRVGIGPCLCAACFEIGPEVVIAASAIAPSSIVQKADKSHLDLRQLLRDDLTEHRVLDAHIEILPNCPRCEVESFFSHRGENGKTGRFGLVAWWK